MEFGGQCQHVAVDGERLTAIELRTSISACIIPVVLSGGGGSRLWPVSTNEKPKQFLPLNGSHTLFRGTVERVSDRSRFAAPIIVGSALHEELLERDLAGIEAQLIFEPCAKNTAAAIAMAALMAREGHGDDALLLVMPSDHVIDDPEAFCDALVKGEAAARAGRLVAFGVRPTAPETGYGYIRLGKEIAGIQGVLEVANFVEKPCLEVAKAIVGDGEHLWNAGIFLFRVGTVLEELREFAPEIARAAEGAVASGARKGDHFWPGSAAMAGCPDKSFDYAVMEHSRRVAVVPMSPGWSDLGSWDSIADMADGQTNADFVTTVDCDDCYVRTDGLRIAALGVRDLIIVASGQRLLIVPRGRSQEVKRLLSAMGAPAT